MAGSILHGIISKRFAISSSQRSVHRPTGSGCKPFWMAATRPLMVHSKSKALTAVIWANWNGCSNATAQSSRWHG